MTIQRTLTLSELTFEEADSRLGKGVIALVPCGAIEAHGPHLPLGTDVIIAETAAVRAAHVLLEAADGLDVLVLPPLAYSVAEYGSSFRGTLSISPETARSLVRDVCVAAMRAGFVGTVLCNAHLEPANIAALDAGAELARKEGALVAFPDITRKPHALRLGEEFKSGACHAGAYETSLVLAADEGAVRREIAAHLPPNPVSLSRAIREGKTTFVEAGGPRAYFGAPAAATVAEGEALYDELAAIFVDAAREVGRSWQTRRS